MKHECLLQSKLLFDLVIPSTKQHLNLSPYHNARAAFKIIKILHVCHKYTQCSVAYDVHGMQVYSTLDTQRFKMLILTKHDPDI